MVNVGQSFAEVSNSLTSFERILDALCLPPLPRAELTQDVSQVLFQVPTRPFSQMLPYEWLSPDRWICQMMIAFLVKKGTY